MDPQLYVEFETDLQVEQWREWTGREYARSVNVPPTVEATPYPMLDTTRFYWSDQAEADNAKTTGGAVFTLDDDVVAFANAEWTLSDGNPYSYDITANAKTYDQLTTEGKAAVDYVPVPPGG